MSVGRCGQAASILLLSHVTILLSTFRLLPFLRGEGSPKPFEPIFPDGPPPLSTLLSVDLAGFDLNARDVAPLGREHVGSSAAADDDNRLALTVEVEAFAARFADVAKRRAGWSVTAEMALLGVLRSGLVRSKEPLEIASQSQN